MLTLYIISVTYYLFQLFFVRSIDAAWVVIICVIFSFLFSNVQLPLKLGTVILCFPFFLIGNRVRRKDYLCFLSRIGFRKKILCGTIGLTVTLLIVEITKDTLLITLNSVGNSISFYIESLFCIFCVIILCSSVNNFGL